MRLDGRPALVTGGSSGVGYALCARLLRAGCPVLTCGRDADRLAAAAAALPGLRTVTADLATADGRAAVVAAVHEHLPGLALLVNNAAVQVTTDWYGRPATDVLHDADREIAVNFGAPLHLVAMLLPLLARDGDTALVNITSGLAVVPKRSAPVYCATKAGLRAFTTSLRYQLAAGAPGVRVVEAVLPLVDTPMTAGRGVRKISADRAAAAILDGVTAGRDVVQVGAVRPFLLLNRLAPGLTARLLRDG